MANTAVSTTGALSAAAFAQAGDQGFSSAKPKSTSGGVPFLKLDKETGVWSYGQEDIALPADVRLATFIQSFATGFVAWKGLTLEAKRMAVIGTQPVDPNTLPPVASKTGWEDNVAVAFVICECKSRPELEGTALLFEQRSRGGIEAWNKLYDATIARARAKAQTNEDDFVAIVALRNTSYDHKEWGKVFKPVFEVVEWDTPAAIAADFGDAPALLQKEANDEQAEGAPVQATSRRRGGAAQQQTIEHVEEAEVVTTEAPRRRRRSAE